MKGNHLIPQARIEKIMKDTWKESCIASGMMDEYDFIWDGLGMTDAPLFDSSLRDYLWESNNEWNGPHE
jgi:hypothetical protein